jgi:hypothetical protein
MRICGPISSVIAAALLSGALMPSFVPSANASVFEYTVTGTDSVYGYSYTADVFLNVSGGLASSGTGTLSGSFATILFGGPETLTLVTPSTPGAETPLGYRDSIGTDIFDVDTVVPVDNNGLLFIIGTPFAFGKNDLFSFWSGPDQALFDGQGIAYLDFASANLTLSQLSLGAAAAPLPSTWTMMLIGFVGLGFIVYRGTKNRSAANAAA